MIDHILGKPSRAFRRIQVIFLLVFWSWRLYIGDLRRRIRTRPWVQPRSLVNNAAGGSTGRGSRVRRLIGESVIWGGEAFWNAAGGKGTGITGWMDSKLGRQTPSQLILGTFTILYALRNLDVILGLGSPEPLARMYSRAYYRATYIATSFDAGFATAMSIKPKWVRDICSILFSGYYMVWATEADEKLRRYRSLCTVEMLRVTWEKTSNPYLRFFTYFDRPRLPIVRKILLPRPPRSKHTKPISAVLYYAQSEEELRNCNELIVDFPGGGFVAMGPEHHEERLRRWTKRTGKPVLAIDYGKAPEYPYPWAIEEGFDVYRTLVETKGSVIGITSGQLDVVLSGDSAGGNIITTIMMNILESSEPILHPLALVLAYPAIDFNYTSWMTPQSLRVLRTEQSSRHIPGIIEGKDHMRHKSPLSVVSDVDKTKAKSQPQSPSLDRKLSIRGKIRQLSGDRGNAIDGSDPRREEDKSLQERVRTPGEEKSMERLQMELQVAANEAREEEEQNRAPIGTRLTMTSRTGYFQDRIISPTMMRAMAILYIGPKHNPDFATDYYISPILAPEKLLAQFPPVYLICGEKDPFVDDSVILAGRLRQAKRNRREEAQRAAAKRSAQARAGLRMSRSDGPNTDDQAILEEDEDDWLSVRIIEGWGHGFMQMLSVMKHDVEPVLLDIADWIDEIFANVAENRDEKRRPGRSNSSPLPRTFSLVKAVHYVDPVPGKTLGSADLGAPLASGMDPEQETDDDADEILSFSTKRYKAANARDLLRDVDTGALPRISSQPRFNFANGNSILDPTDIDFASHSDTIKPSKPPRGSYAFFTQKKAEAPRVAVPPYLRDSKTRTTSPASSDHSKGGLTEAELMRRRRVEAVYGMVDDFSTMSSSLHEPSEDEERDEDRGFRW